MTGPDTASPGDERRVVDALAAIAAELYGLPRDAFTSARDERVREVRRSGDRELAGEVARLRKPSVAAWLVNLLVREHPDEIAGLADLGGLLRSAQGSLEGEALRQLSRQRHELVHALVERARALGRGAGQRVGDTVERELERTFSAALADAEAARALSSGRLVGALDPSQASSLAAAPDRDDNEQPRTEQPRTEQEPEPRRVEERRRLQAELDDMGAERERARAEREARSRDVSDAEARAERAAASVRDLRERLEAAQADQHDADERAVQARRAYASSDHRAQEVDARLTELRQRLEQL